jgi:hypothetical protein
MPALGSSSREVTPGKTQLGVQSSDASLGRTLTGSAEILFRDKRNDSLGRRGVVVPNHLFALAGRQRLGAGPRRPLRRHKVGCGR